MIRLSTNERARKGVREMTNEDHTTVVMRDIPKCDLCVHDVAMNKAGSQKLDARYDGKTVMGPWAYMCETHFARLGVGLGEGKGQELIKAGGEEG